MISVTARHAPNAAAAVTSQTNKRHMVAVKQLILIMLVYIVSFVPPLIAMSVPWISFWIMYLVYINNVANFFIYLAVKKEFRNEAKVTISMIIQKVRPGAEQKIFVLRWFTSGMIGDCLNQCRNFIDHRRLKPMALTKNSSTCLVCLKVTNLSVVSRIAIIIV